MRRTRRRLLLGTEILLTYVRARWLLRRRDLDGALLALRRDAVDGDHDAAHDAVAGAQLGSAVGRALSLVPADSRCLMRSLVLSGLLGRRGIPSSLLIGVRPGERFGAHAWVEVAGRPVLEPGGDEYQELVAL